MEERERRGLSFGPAAGDYERVRPSYPGSAVAWLVGARPRRVLDLGAGTGKLTRVLVALGHDVVAVEPLEEMRGQLAAALPAVQALPGTAEEIPLPDASVDAIAVGQAFHWFDTARAVPELARVLRPGGTLGLIWNVRDEREPWVAALARSTSAEWLRPGWSDSIGEPDFGPLERRDFRFVQELSPEELVALIGSRSSILTLPDEERVAALARVRELVTADPALAGRRAIRLPYVTQAYRAERR
jgi:SAM-dependent methyltransferase